MSKECPFGGCYAPEISCANGEAKHEECEHWKSLDITHAASDSPNPTETWEYRFPWTGNAMGVEDLNYLAGSGTARLLTLAGAANAGKTSLLAAFYLLIARGVSPQGVSFAGSLTLEGWENIASSLRWSSRCGPSFPPHTSSGTGRRPGLLHLSLANEDRICDLLAADAPGEWFTEWATNKGSSLAQGARWLSETSDVFLIIADSQALSGSQRGQARKGLFDLLRRVGDQLHGRPVGLVWTKSDITVPTEIEKAVEEAATRSLSEYRSFRVSMHPPASGDNDNRGRGIIELFSWILTVKSNGYEYPIELGPERHLLRAYGKQ